MLGYFEADDALHLSLDIGFIWTIFPDAEMGLLPQTFALKELNIDADERASLNDDLRRLREEEEEFDAATRARITPAPAGCLIEEVRLLAQGIWRKLEIQGDLAGLVVVASPITGEMSVEQWQR